MFLCTPGPLSPCLTTPQGCRFRCEFTTGLEAAGLQILPPCLSLLPRQTCVESHFSERERQSDAGEGAVPAQAMQTEQEGATHVSHDLSVEPPLHWNMGQAGNTERTRPASCPGSWRSRWSERNPGKSPGRRQGQSQFPGEPRVEGQGLGGEAPRPRKTTEKPPRSPGAGLSSPPGAPKTDQGSSDEGLWPREWSATRHWQFIKAASRFGPGAFFNRPLTLRIQHLGFPSTPSFLFYILVLRDFFFYNLVNVSFAGIWLRT